MRPQLSKPTEWKLDTFAEQMLHGAESDNLPASQKVRLLVERHREFMDETDSTWIEQAADMRAGAKDSFLPGHYDSTNKSEPNFHKMRRNSEPRRMYIDDEIVEDLKEELEKEKPAQAKLNQSFDNVLGLVLESYNAWASQLGVGWE